jgi:polyisoprenyl-teichoic acid--peptidoglycan teichoic acid transferase
VPEPRTPKPYRTYRGGRAGNDPEAARFDFGGAGTGTATPRRARTPRGMRRPDMAPPPRLPGRRVAQPGPPRRRRLPIGWRRGILLGLGIVVLGLAVWLYLGYRAFSSEMAKANARVPKSTRAALTPAGGSILTTPQISLIMGSDSRGTNALAGARADSILLFRTDPGKHLLSMLSIPRDLYVPIPGHGRSKINAAFAWGGPPLLIRTVKRFTGLPVNHLVLVDFGGFKDLIDSMGGVTIDNPYKVVSSKPFDGYYWHFKKGVIHLDGRHALAYSRIRETTNPRDSDITRTERQQRVMQALEHQLSSPWNIFHLRSIGREIAKPLSTDLTAPDMLELGWVKFRSGRTLQCHLGGIGQFVGGQDVIMPTPQDRAVVQMFLGTQAPQPPAPGSLLAPGCRITG